MIEYELRAMIESEDKYTFRQSTQINALTGLIGYLRADMDTDGNGFFGSWNGVNDSIKTEEFKKEFDQVINSLREEGAILNNRSAMSKYCYSHPQSKMNTQQDYYGVRVDTEKYSYLLRLNPNRGEYNLYCYCYVRDWLECHMENAEHGIRFITPHYEEKFRIPDGDTVRIFTSCGETRDRVARYIDDYHVEIGDNLYHICEFAERMEKAGNTVIPLRSSLPETAFVYLSAEHEIGIVRKGETGYYKTDLQPLSTREENEALVQELNEDRKITKAQAAAMSAGSMFGWGCPAADPASYDAEGVLHKDNHKCRGDAR